MVSSGTTSPLLELLDSPSKPLLGLLGSPSGPIRLPLLLMGPREPILDRLAFRLTVLVELLLLDTMGLCNHRCNSFKGAARGSSLSLTSINSSTSFIST